MNRIQKIKKSLAENADMIVIGTVFVASLATLAYIVKIQAEATKEYNEQINAALARGASVFQHSTGAFIVEPVQN